MNVMGYDYTGYGCSSGQPSVAATIADLEAVVECLLQRFKLQPRDVVLYGQSVGSGGRPFSCCIRRHGRFCSSCGGLSPVVSSCHPLADGPVDSPAHQKVRLRPAVHGGRLL